MKKHLLYIFFFLCVMCANASGLGTYKIYGTLIDQDTKEPITGATITLNGGALWTVSNNKGEFAIEKLSQGEYHIAISFIGYGALKRELTISDKSLNLNIKLSQSTLEIDQVIVTAQSNKEELSTTYQISREAINHTQVTDIANISALLPGGVTSNPDLTSEQTFSLRDAGSDNGNASFGTAIEVDGVRIGSNSSFSAPSGSTTRNIPVGNIESVEIITGVPSVEYGDINSGIVKIKTLRGASPLNATLTINPKTYMASASKGIAIGEDLGVINASGEWARATSSLVSPYTSYTRGGMSLVYSNTAHKNIKYEAGLTANIGGSNSEDDPDAYTGEYSKGKDNVIRAQGSLSWLANKNWATNLSLDFSANYQDKTTQDYVFYSYASAQPSVHSSSQGYFVADQLDYSFFADKYTENKLLDLSGALKYELNNKFGSVDSRLKAGLQWKLSDNLGRGEYYSDMATAPSGFRERDYSEYPAQNNLSFYLEQRISLPINTMRLTLIAGLRTEQLFVKDAVYDNTISFSPRFNAALKVNGNLTIKAGWGITEKLPSYYVLYPETQYRDILSFGATYNNNEAFYSYYTQPYALETNENLTWQRSQNSELSVDYNLKGVNISLTGYYNITKDPYQYSSYYSPFSYNTYVLPDGYSMPNNPQIEVDAQTGNIYVRDLDNLSLGWTQMDLNVTNTTFTKTTYADNGADIHRRGVELVIDFPEIKKIKTRFRVDAAYANMKYLDNTLSYNYSSGLSHTTETGKSYQYVGIYALGSNSSSVTYNGCVSNKLNANITMITHIPKARLILTLRAEFSLLNRWQYLSEYNGKNYAFNSDEYGNPTGGSIYDGDSYTSIYPVQYMDTNGNIYDFTSKEASDPNFSNLILTSNNAYTYNNGGYDPYLSLNLSVTKEIGKYIALSFHANNFTFSRQAVTSYSTGVSAIFVPSFYYGLTCRLKF